MMLPGLVTAFIVVPVVELYLIFTVSRQLGLAPTLGLLLAISVLGGVLVKREGLRAWRTLRDAVARGSVPGRRDLADGALVLVGGVLLLAPGFLTDAVGLVFVLPPTRPLARRLLLRLAARRRPEARRPGTGRVVDVTDTTGERDR